MTSKLDELRELQIGHEYAQDFFHDLGELVEQYYEKGADIELVAFYLDLGATALKAEILAEATD